MKKCPNCGSLMDPAVKFCTNCGTNLQNVPLQAEEPVEQAKPAQKEAGQKPAQQTHKKQASQAKVQNDQPTQAKSRVQANQQQTRSQASEVGANYWNWLKTSWQKPDHAGQGQWWFGLINICVEILLVTFAAINLVHRFSSAVTGSNSLGEGTYSSSSEADLNSGIAQSINSQGSSTIWQLFFATIIAVALLIVVAALVKKFIFNGHVTATDVLAKIGAASNYNLIIGLLVLLFSFGASSEGPLTFIGILVMLMLFVFSAALLYYAFSGEKAQRSYFWGAIIYLLGSGIASMIFSSMAASIVVSLFRSTLSSLFN